jgi:hypothetical protein
MNGTLSESLVPHGAGEPPPLDDLRGHDLCCWCPLDSPCHGDVLLELANTDA